MSTSADERTITKLTVELELADGTTPEQAGRIIADISAIPGVESAGVDFTTQASQS